MFSVLNMTKSEAIALFKNASDLAAQLGISRSAVSQWPESAAIPREHELAIRFVLRPDAFGAGQRPDVFGESPDQAAA